MRIGRIAAALMMAAFAAGCGGADTDADNDEMADLPALEPPGAPAGETPLPPDTASVQGVEATLTEWSVTLSQDSVPAGPTAFSIRNTGTLTHRFEVEGGGEEWETEDIAPGGEVTMSVNLSPGSYQVYCPIEADGVNHEARGMTTTLRVY